MGFDKRIMAPGIGHYSVCTDGFETLGLALRQTLLLINSLAMRWDAEGRDALAVDAAFASSQNASKTSVIHRDGV